MVSSKVLISVSICVTIYASSNLSFDLIMSLTSAKIDESLLLFMFACFSLFLVFSELYEKEAFVHLG
jgi:hypothetical protein